MTATSSEELRTFDRATIWLATSTTRMGVPPIAGLPPAVFAELASEDTDPLSRFARGPLSPERRESDELSARMTTQVTPSCPPAAHTCRRNWEW